MQGLSRPTMLIHEASAIQWIAEKMNSLCFEHASVEAKGKLNAQIVISSWEGWSPQDKQCRGRACSRALARLVVIVQRHVHEPLSFMVKQHSPEGSLSCIYLSEMQGSSQQFHAYYIVLQEYPSLVIHCCIARFGDFQGASRICRAFSRIQQEHMMWT